MTTQAAAIEEVAPVDRIDMSHQNAENASQVNTSQVLTESMTTALDNALRTPALPSEAELSIQQVLNKSGENDFIGNEVGETHSPIEEVRNVATEIAGIYSELTSFQVAWNIAKKSGRDVETLLKGQ